MKARLLDWSELHPGLVVFEEWMHGNGVSRGVVRYIRDNAGALQMGGYITLICRKDSGVRYWDAEPTEAQREETPW